MLASCAYRYRGARHIENDSGDEHVTIEEPEPREPPRGGHGAAHVFGSSPARLDQQAVRDLELALLYRA